MSCSPSGPGQPYSCEGDAVCASDEGCTTAGVCVPLDRIECRVDNECPQGQRCVLSGISAEGRGNTATRSFCR